MTVSELITELQKHPGHYPVWLLTCSDGPDVDPGFEEQWSAIDDVAFESNIGDMGCVVKIMGEP